MISSDNLKDFFCVLQVSYSMLVPQLVLFHSFVIANVGH